MVAMISTSGCSCVLGEVANLLDNYWEDVSICWLVFLCHNVHERYKTLIV